jgi:PAS domain S-box-containing protein
MPAKALSSSPRAELRAIRWFSLTHGIGLLLFTVMIAGLLFYLHRMEVEQQRGTLYRDIDWAQQSIRLRLRDAQDEIVAASADWALSPHIDDNGIANRARDFLTRNPDASYLAMIDADRKVAWMLPGRGVVSVISHREPGASVDDSAGYRAFHTLRDTRRPTFTEPFMAYDGEVSVELHTPILRDGELRGAIVVGYSLDRLIVLALTGDVRSRYHLQIIDQDGNTLVSSSSGRKPAESLGYEIGLDPPGHGIRLRAYAFDMQPNLLERSLAVAVVGLSLASVISLMLLWRHARRRIAAEAERDRLFDLSEDLMCSFNSDGAFLRVNPAFELAFGVDGANRTLSELVHPEDREGIEALLHGGTGGSAMTFEARFEVGRGWRWFHWSVRSDPERAAGTRYAIAHDVTERRAAEAALAAETSFRQAMEDSMLTGMRAFDMEGRITYVNRAFCEMIGFSAEELVGTAPPYPYWPTHDRSENQRQLGMILRGEAPASGFETPVQRKDGSAFFARMYISPLVDRDGRQTGWMTSMTDITEPKRVREELAAAHERFATVLDQLEAAIWVMPLPNQAGELSRADGLAPEPLFANRVFRSLFSASGDLPRLLRATEQMASGWLPQELHLPGLDRWFAVRPREIRWVDGRMVRMIVAADITRKHQIEEQHREQEQRLQRTARLVTMGEMASSLAHELNQPLTAIANYCMGLSARIRRRMSDGNPLDGPELLEMLGKTASQAERAGMVIRRIRGFVKRSEPERTPCEVSVIVADAVGLAEIDAQRLGKRVEVQLEPGLPTISADPILIEQVLLNLVKNGIEAMRQTAKAELYLSVGVRGDHVEFAVADAGTGLSPEARDKLFEPFFTTKTEGMGMGLNICRSIIESHQGRLWVDSNESGGCTFRFTLPLDLTHPVAQAA